MAMKGLVEGDCGGTNPLLNLASHYTQDRGYVNEGLQGGQLNVQLGPGQEGGLVREFLSETHQVTSRPPQTFRMDSLLQEMRDIESQRSLGAIPRQAPPVADLATSGDTWAAEYLDTVDTDQNVIDWSRDFLAEHSLGGPDPVMAQHLSSGTSLGQDEVLWAEQYLDDVPTLQNSTSNGPSLDPQEFQEFIASVGKERSSAAVIQDNAWAEEFSQFTETDVANVEKTETYKQEFWKKLEDEWQEITKDEASHPWLNDFNTTYDPFKEYKYDQNNPVKDHPNPLEEGKKMLALGDLPSAVLYFESAVQQQPDSAEAWQLLGSSQAENEQDPAAITALRKCLSVDPSNRAAWMSLAVSFTNENYQAQACHALTKWIEHNSEYSGLLPTSHRAGLDQTKLKFTNSFMSQELHEETTKLYIKAARQRQGSDFDPDVQAGLGVLFNLSGEFDKAIDCFRAAISARPSDSLLWNRLGATLANGNRSEEAVSAYHTALSHSPGFVRCRYNLGVSCINLKAYKEAAEHFLTALNFQDSSRGPGQDSKMSDSIWNSLRLSVNLMQRRDLSPMLENRNLAGLCAEFGLLLK